MAIDTDRRYRDWIASGYWMLDGPGSAAIGIILGKEPTQTSFPGEPPEYGFDVTPEERANVLYAIEADRNRGQYRVTEMSYLGYKFVRAIEFLEWAEGEKNYPVPEGLLQAIRTESAAPPTQYRSVVDVPSKQPRSLQMHSRWMELFRAHHKAPTKTTAAEFDVSVKTVQNANIQHRSSVKPDGRRTSHSDPLTNAWKSRSSPTKNRK